jgi:outer membrane protein TolC
MKVSLTPLLCLLATAISTAQEPALGLSELMREALRKNADMQTQYGENRIAALNRSQAFSRLLPQIDAEAGYLRTSGHDDFPDLVGANGSAERIAWLTLRQPLFDAEILSHLAAARLAQAKQEVLSAQTKQEVLLQVIEPTSPPFRPGAR